MLPIFYKDFSIQYTSKKHLYDWKGKQNHYKIGLFAITSVTIPKTHKLTQVFHYTILQIPSTTSIIMFTKVLSLLAFSLVGTTSAQITYLPGTEITAAVWTNQAQPVEQGNGVYISPDGALAVVVSRDASVKAINSINGEDVWTIQPPTATAQSFGGAFFCSSQYILYSYVDTATNVR